jgi:hypothetical protein
MFLFFVKENVEQCMRMCPKFLVQVIDIILAHVS